jgi:perosamine synthetase|tara:strand:- start:4608 stop:5750 length:1143 start_codon:yes stop_codon:yes gene_type:complete
MKIPFGKPLIGKEERNVVAEVLSGPILVHGPKAIEFENEFKHFSNAPYAVTVSSCTAGMHLIYFTLGLGPGDEVIIPAQTHIATAHAVELTGAKPIFVDVENQTGNIDITKIESKINQNTKAIAVVHYLGVPADMKEIKLITDKYNIFLLEDCALAPGAYYENIHVGLYGDAGVFSFYPVKHITTAEGGMIILKDKKLAEKLKLKKAFGVDRTHGERKIPGIYETIDLGFNYRMSEIHAAIGIEQIKKLPAFLKQRKSNYELLSHFLSKVNKIRILPQPQNEIKISCHYCLNVLLDESIVAKRPQIMDHLKKEGIGTSIYYPQPVPRMKYYREKYGYDLSLYKNAAKISDHSIALPVGPHLDQSDIEFIAKNLIQILKNL